MRNNGFFSKIEVAIPPLLQKFDSKYLELLQYYLRRRGYVSR